MSRSVDITESTEAVHASRPALHDIPVHPEVALSCRKQRSSPPDLGTCAIVNPGAWTKAVEAFSNAARLPDVASFIDTSPRRAE